MEYILRLSKDEYEFLKVIIGVSFDYTNEGDAEYELEKSIMDKLGINTTL